jgi:hypothetical protein
MNIFNYIKIMLVYKNEKLLQYAKYKLKNIKKKDMYNIIPKL